jgi:multicomponent Na+:H+ antiporter subunit E
LALLSATAVREVVRANIGLARRIWSPRLRLASGMVIVPTDAQTDGELAAVGLLTSLVVDNQLVDLDRSRHALQYHAVEVPTDRRSIIAKIEPRVLKVTRR